ncbi:hypothetical protein FA13DRAFT_1252570 [Coprinellus micaceus]|uniref:Uncharacterized protein n=1 Tax=Coprinellus micaceus TaxID=71717 RepID=A0A4Y7TQE5_COPMI|nr:hypothetical protein FA13DRAFT_1252570 [Coprinellus micaceus]
MTRLEPRRPRRQPKQSQKSLLRQPGYNHTPAGPTRTIRLYKNSPGGLLRQDSISKDFVYQGIPHPRPHEHLLTTVGKLIIPTKETSEQQEVAYIPLPIPATIATTKSKHGAGYDLINVAANLTKAFPKGTSGHAPQPTGAGNAWFTPLPPLPSLAVGTQNDLPQASDELPTPTLESVSTPQLTRHGKPAPTPKIGIPLIVLLSVGIGFFLLGAYLVFRFWTRPRHIGKIRPSLPIREKSYAYDEEAFNHEGKESPVFGGKERSASRLTGDAPLWTWVQYAKPDPKDQTHTTLSSSQPLNAGEETVIVNTVPPSPPHQPLTTKKRVSSTLLPFAAPLHNTTLSQVPRKRVSAASFYRNRDSVNGEVGVAITGDGYPIMERSRSKLARRSQSYSALAERRRRDSAYRPDTAYEGADVSSPTTYFQPVTTPHLGASPAPGNEGRARIQSSYYALAPFPRLSSMPASIGTARKVHISKAYATERRSETTGDSSGHGFVEDSLYLPASPQATLYPDDSMSVIAAGRQKRRSQLDPKRASKHGTVDAATAQGLLEMDFGVSRMSISELAEGNLKMEDKYPAPSFQSNLHQGDSKRSHGPGRTYDRPPRVPSPPPLPSLTQMALSHSNPEAYSNYRSPTYSIYGLYGPERKSNV